MFVEPTISKQKPVRLFAPVNVRWPPEWFHMTTPGYKAGRELVSALLVCFFPNPCGNLFSSGKDLESHIYVSKIILLPRPRW